MHWLVCRCHQGGKLPWPTPSTLPSPPQCSHWHLQSISFILKRHRFHSKGNFWRDLFGKDVLKWNIEAGPLPGTHSRNRQPVSGASAPRPFFCPPAPLSNNYSTHRYSPFNQQFTRLCTRARVDNVRVVTIPRNRPRGQKAEKPKAASTDN